VEVFWKALQIHPEIPREGYVGTSTNSYRSIARERARKLGEGLGVKLALPNRISNSRFALEGAEFARDHHQFEHYHEAVFRAYFIEGKDIGNLDVLAGLAGQCELDRELFIEALRQRRYAQCVNASIEEARVLFIYEVPTFIIGKKRLIGVQPFETLMEVLVETQ
jgi:predicted DsbA family dithiol-disulfide isomerase